MKKKDLILILGIVCLALALLCVGLFTRAGRPHTGGGAESTDAELQQSYSDEALDAVRSYFEEYPAESYLIVKTASGTSMPIPLNSDNAFTVKQSDGSENVVHIGKNSFYMEASNCENQNCVEQGEVTLENRDTRILLNLVICLPHNLSLELLTPEEAQSLLLDLYGQDEAAPNGGPEP